MADELVYVPREINLLQAPKKRRVCRPAYNLIKCCNMVLIDKQNPILVFKPELRRLMVQRRSVHKMFDMIKCDDWESLISDQDCKFLVLRDSYLTFDLIAEPRRLEQIITELHQKLETHLQKC